MARVARIDGILFAPTPGSRRSVVGRERARALRVAGAAEADYRGWTSSRELGALCHVIASGSEFILVPVVVD
jgi:hypothetical protein